MLRKIRELSWPPFSLYSGVGPKIERDIGIGSNLKSFCKDSGIENLSGSGFFHPEFLGRSG